MHIINTVLAAGGTVSKLCGGSFTNGAVTGAFAYLFNAVAHSPVLDRLRSIFSNGNGFGYHIVDHVGNFYSGEVTDENGMWDFKSDVIAAKSTGPLESFSLTGHGAVGLDRLGGVLFNTDVVPRGPGSDMFMTKPTLAMLFKGAFNSNSMISLEFCYSADTPKIGNFFRTIAPNAQIWGYHGTIIGDGDYGHASPIEFYKLRLIK